VAENLAQGGDKVERVAGETWSGYCYQPYFRDVIQQGEKMSLQRKDCYAHCY